MDVSSSHARQFVRDILPLMEHYDLDQLVELLRSDWPRERLREVMFADDEAAKTAAVCLVLVGQMEDTPALACLLHHDDPAVAGFAEHALWSIWFRDGDPQTNETLERAVKWIGDAHLPQAIALLEHAIEQNPKFAEVQNQLAIALFLSGRYEESIESCRLALRLNPHHFGAMAGLGHCYASLGQFEQSLQAYRCALQMQPRMAGIRQAMAHVRKAARRQASQPKVAPPPKPMIPYSPMPVKSTEVDAARKQ
jgi:tetratricopeptide (TPR) repeat protein